MKPDKRQYDAIFNTGIGTIGFQMAGSSLSRLDFLKGRAVRRPGSKPVMDIQRKIEDYLKADTQTGCIDVDVELNVTAFQKQVLEQLVKIPWGETRTYGEIARILGTSPRAVGNACRNNPVPVIIPCHRIVAAGGIGGYAGATEGWLHDIKTRLLRLEGAI